MIKIEKVNKYLTTEEIKKMCEEALNQDNKEDIIREIKYLKDR